MERTPRARRGAGPTAKPSMLFGSALTLKLADSAAARPLHVQGAELIVAMGGPAPEVHRAAQFRTGCASRRSTCFSERVEHYRVLARDLELSPDVLLSSARTRWGSCHASGRIRLNWRLVQMPPRLLDYVVAHEVAHLLEMNHSPRFWRTCGTLVPDYAARRNELRREGHRYLLV